MSEPIVIYAANDLQQAHMLKNELEQHGIRAWVTNETLARGFGVECPSWSTLPRVVVAEKDAIIARQIALSHDKLGAQTIDSQLPDPPHFEENPEAWPRCPECNAPRPTRCPICKTTGTNFPESDPEFAWGFGLEEVMDPVKDAPPSACNTSCSCSSGGGCGEPSPNRLPGEEESENIVEESGEDEDHEHPFILRCTMCDEPFSPEFPNICTWCGQVFDDGYDVDYAHDLPPRDSPVRIIFTILGLMVIGLLVIWMFIH